jgi:hypothetical protein
LQLRRGHGACPSRCPGVSNGAVADVREPCSSGCLGCPGRKIRRTGGPQVGKPSLLSQIRWISSLPPRRRSCGSGWRSGSGRPWSWPRAS